MRENKIWMYWENIKSKEIPEYIDLCMDTIKNNSPGWDVVLVTPENVEKYVRNLRSDFHQIPEVAHKADYLRAALLWEHGGCWFDADTILLKDLNPLIKENNEKGAIFYAWKKNTPSIGFIWAKSGHELLEDWLENINNKLDLNINQNWTGIGSDILWPLIKENSYSYVELPHTFCATIHWKNNDHFLLREPCENFIENHTVMIQLNNKMLYHKVGGWKKKELLEKDIVLSQLFNLSFENFKSIQAGF